MLRSLLGSLFLLASAEAQPASLRLLDDLFQNASYATVPGYQQGALLRLFGVWDKAMQFQRVNGVKCYESIMIDAVAQGSFTAPKVVEKAYLYTYCQTGRQLFERGLAVTQGNSVVFNLKLNSIGGHGLTGISEQGITLIELSGRAYRTLLRVTTGSDNCGAVTGASGLAQSRVIKVQPGKTPLFFADVYEGDCTAASDHLIRLQEALK